MLAGPKKEEVTVCLKVVPRDKTAPLGCKPEELEAEAEDLYEMAINPMLEVRQIWLVEQ